MGVIERDAPEPIFFTLAQVDGSYLVLFAVPQIPKPSMSVHVVVSPVALQ